MSNETKSVEEIHNIREKIYEETKHLTPEERAKKREKTGVKIAEKYGLKIKQKV